ncbi:pentatricopeptide repeat-containing protein At4g02750-like [Selaginella moellendorffii]|uniref:pentatricopeptide repeat-containing protein At4g02750-like n=1 Tax=Selaginella moellendorffii TaxID=88036 RepID=UPI000D1CB2BA|nr:pentatricopeptide repeat-containing protein At4g02750-like [Selaginella moellendorffii]|eukprot:XP_024535945.1 pentatricopeptide repeat-containing protein At4g02750-like [Selaginella moellendorffii]
MPERDSVSWTSMMTAYARTGQMSRAEETFAAMPEKNLVSWNAILSQYAQGGHIRDMERIFEEMPARNIISWNTVVGAYSQHDIEKGAMFFQHMPYRNVVSWNSMLSGYAHNGHIHQAVRFFECIPELDIVSVTIFLPVCGNIPQAHSLFEKIPEHNLPLCCAMLSAYSHFGRLDGVWSFFSSLPWRNLACWNAVLSSHIRNGCPYETMEIFTTQMPEHDSSSSTSVMLAHIQTGNIENAKFVFDTMPERTPAAWNAMIEAFFSIGDISSATKMFSSMPHRSPSSWNTMLSAYAQAGHIDIAKGIFASTPQRNVVSWTSMIAANAQVGDLVEVRKLFESMPEGDPVAWSSILSAYAQRGESLATIATFTDMKLFYMPDKNCFLAALLACTHEGRVESAKEYVVGMAVDFGVDPAMEHYCCLVDVLARAGQLGSALELAASMPFEAGAWQWRKLLAACRSFGDVGYGIQAAKYFLSSRPRDSTAYVFLSSLVNDPIQSKVSI